MDVFDATQGLQSAHGFSRMFEQLPTLLCRGRLSTVELKQNEEGYEKNPG